MKKVGSKEMVSLVGLCVGVVLASGCKTRYSGFDRGETVVGDGTEIKTETVKTERKTLTLNSGEYPMPGFMTPEEKGTVIYPDAKPAKQPEYWQQHADPYAGMVPSSAKTVTSTKGVASGYTTYKVKSGDNLGKIAQKHGVTLRDVKAVNAGINYDKLAVGQTIYIPTQKGVGGANPKIAKSGTSATAGTGSQAGIHVVKNGDILGRIARQYGVSVKELKAVNGLTSDKIKVGQKLKIPGKAVSTAKAQEVEKAGTSKTVKKEKPKAEVKPVSASVSTPVVTPAVVDEPVIEAPVVAAPVISAPVVSAPEMPSFADPVQEMPIVAPPVVAPKAEYRTYTTKEGDDLYTIAIEHSVGVKPIEELNPGLKKPLEAGTVIKIPAPTK